MLSSEKRCCCRNYVGIASGIVFALIAIVHLVRAVAGWPVLVSGSECPLWMSWLVVVISAVLAGGNFCAACCKTCGEQCKKCCIKEDNPQPPKLP